MKRTDILQIVGFLLFLLGFVSVVLTLVGGRLSFLAFIDLLPSPFPFVTKMLMIIVGILLTYIVRIPKN